MKKLVPFVLFIFFNVLISKAQITVSSNNYVGIGTSTPAQMLTVNGSVQGNVNGALNINTGNGTLTIGPQNTAWTHIYTDRPSGFIFNAPLTLYNEPICGYINSSGNAYDLWFNTNNTQRVIIKGSTGYVGINNPNPTCALDVTGIIKMNGAQVQTSDERLKYNIKPLSSALDSLTNLRSVEYLLKPNGYQALSDSLNANSTVNSDTVANSKKSVVNTLNTKKQVLDTVLYNRVHIGFLAQEVQKVFPELVYADKNGILSVDYVSLIPVLVESIKEQQAMISALQADVAALKKKSNTP